MKATPREVGGLLSNEWVELGFQGSDPTTDFRSMGILGLQQLHYFACKRPEVARHILKELSTPSCTYPFAIIGINLTRLIMELFTGFRLHQYIVERFGNLTINCGQVYSEGPSNDSDCIEFCNDLVHDVYCSAFEEFYMVWVIRKPKSIMDFNSLYEEVRNIMLDRFRPIP